MTPFLSKSKRDSRPLGVSNLSPKKEDIQRFQVSTQDSACLGFAGGFATKRKWISRNPYFWPGLDRMNQESLTTTTISDNTLPKTNMAPEKQWLEDEFPFGMAYFQVLC